MKIKGMILARAIQPASLSPGRYIPDAVQSIRERYGFVRAPCTPEELLSRENPLTFSHGKLVAAGRTHVVNELSVYSGSLVADFVTSTDDAELLLDDIAAWGIEQGLVLSAERRYREFVSQLEVEMSVDLDDALSALSGLRRSLARRLSNGAPEQSGVPAQVGVYSLGLSVDPSLFVTSCDFRIERRHAHPFASNIYFAQAPLKTSDHVAMLEEFEQAFTRKDSAKR